MADLKGFYTKKLDFNRKLLIASSDITRKKNTIHCIAEVDVTKVLQILDKKRLANGKKLSFTGYIACAFAETISHFPGFNSFVKGSNIIVLKDITISVLIERELNGELIPEPLSLKNLQNKSLFEITNEIRKAKGKEEQNLGSLEKMSWIRYVPSFLLRTMIKYFNSNIKMARKYGKLAITSPGMFSKNPIFFIPHGSATVLLTLGSMSSKIELKDSIEKEKKHLHLTASFDHNIIDGAPAARFMDLLIDNISQPNKYL